MKLSISSDTTFRDISVVDVLDGRSALRTTPFETRMDPENLEIMSAVSPVGVEETIAYVVSCVEGNITAVDGPEQRYLYSASDMFPSNPFEFLDKNSTHPEPASVRLRYGLRGGSGVATVFKYVGVASSDHFGHDAETVARDVARTARDGGYEALRHGHGTEVGRLMHPNFVADFRNPSDRLVPSDKTIMQLQITAISSAYYLYTSLVPFDAAVDSDAATCRACNSLPVGGLVSQTYGGKIFWDADLFMAPAVQGTHPRLARQFSLYRINRAAQARQNTERHGLKEGSMLYPWTSGRYGQCYNISGPCVMYQYHLNADIALSLVMARNTSGDGAWFDGAGAAEVVDGVAMGLGEMLTFRNETGTWGIDVMTDADEYYMFVADGSFTSSAISNVLEMASNLRRERGAALEQDWLHKTENMAIPTSDDGVVLEFRGMPSAMVAKQADVILSNFPYRYRRDFSIAKRRLAMDYYSVRTDPDGPAMTWSLYAVSANTLGTAGCAFWTFLVKSFQPYVRAPWYQYSEQQDDNPSAKDPLTGQDINPAFPFLTGHGGLLQVFTAGFLGLRVTDENLVILPSLPPQLAHFKPPIQFYNGAVVAFRMNRTHTTITRLDASLFDGLVPDRYGEADMPITVGQSADDEHGHTVLLAVNGSVVVRNRLYDGELDVPGNVLQCKSAASDHGGLPFAATDGYAGTYWQPESSSSTAASLVVDMSGSRPVPLASVYLDFAMRPPRTVRVSLSDTSTFDEGTVEVIAEERILVTSSWVPDSPVVRYVGNITEIPLHSRVWSAKYVKLDVQGCWVEDGAGATVAEFGLIARD